MGRALSYDFGVNHTRAADAGAAAASLGALHSDQTQTELISSSIAYLDFTAAVASTILGVPLDRLFLAQQVAQILQEWPPGRHIVGHGRGALGDLLSAMLLYSVAQLPTAVEHVGDIVNMILAMGVSSVCDVLLDAAAFAEQVRLFSNTLHSGGSAPDDLLTEAASNAASSSAAALATQPSGAPAEAPTAPQGSSSGSQLDHNEGVREGAHQGDERSGPGQEVAEPAAGRPRARGKGLAPTRTTHANTDKSVRQQERPVRQAAQQARRLAQQQLAAMGEALPQRLPEGGVTLHRVRGVALLLRRLGYPFSTDDTIWLAYFLPSWYLSALDCDVHVTYDISSNGTWEVATLVAKSVVLPRLGVQGQFGAWVLRAFAAGDHLPPYEGVVGRGRHATEEAALHGYHGSSEHVQAFRLDNGTWAVIDGRRARPGGMQNMNDISGTGRSPDALIHPDLDITAARPLVAVHPDMTPDMMAACEVLTDYGKPFWAAARRSTASADQASTDAPAEGSGASTSSLISPGRVVEEGVPHLSPPTSSSVDNLRGGVLHRVSGDAPASVGHRVDGTPDILNMRVCTTVSNPAASSAASSADMSCSVSSSHVVSRSREASSLEAASRTAAHATGAVGGAPLM